MYFYQVDRRKFIKNTGVIGGAAILPISCLSPAKDPNYPMGYQLYSVRDAMAENPIETLKALKGMGYQDFEAYGFDDEKGMYYGFQSAEFKRILDDMDLSVTSGHYGFSPYLEKGEDELRRFVDRCIVGAKALNSKYITWPWIAPEQRTIDNFKLMSLMLNKIGEQVTKANLGFAYHNHGFEFEDHDGENGFDIIIRDTDPALVKLEMDMYWVMHSSKYTPEQLIDSQPGRYVLWHIKDMDKVSRDYTELGNGSIDYLTLLPDPVKSGLDFYYLDKGGNFASNSMESASQSAEYFKNHLQQYL